jgi:hypothetical protein
MRRQPTRTILARMNHLLEAALVVAPVVMGAATLIERRLGPSAAGWVAALPISFAVAVLAVTLDAGAHTASTMALSAATHAPAQAAFAVVFAAVLTRRGLLLGCAAGTLAYVACSVGLAHVPTVLILGLAVPVLALAPRLISHSGPRIGSPRRWSATVLTCAAAPLIVAAAVLTSRAAGPVAAGAVAAFPTMSTTLAIALVARDGALAGAHALSGLIRSLPCYLTFCLVVVLGAPAASPPALALAVMACLATGHLTWRRVPRATSIATAQ